MTNDYFREALEMDFKDRDILTKEELRGLMRLAGYRRKTVKGKTHKKEPSQKQLSYAWFYINRIQGKLGKGFQEKRYGRIATTDLYIRGKLYHKGQFLPRRKRKGR